VGALYLPCIDIKLLPHLPARLLTDLAQAYPKMCNPSSKFRSEPAVGEKQSKLPATRAYLDLSRILVLATKTTKTNKYVYLS
jgi:hypothetical protein